MPDFSGILAILQLHQDLTRQQMREAIGYLLSGIAQDDEIASFLGGLALKGETADELAGAAEAMRDSMVRIHTQRHPVVDTCGTGGDGSKTFNISTAAALALAASGVAVAKHGNRKITSSTGSADVLAELGVNLEAPPAVAEKCLNDLGICFCFAPFFHPAMKHVGKVRTQLGHPTIFNRLGPLSNPALADCQVLGVGAESLQDAMASTLQLLGTRRSLVVRGEDGVDEISIAGPTRVLEVTPTKISEHHWEPADFGLATAIRDDLFADSPATSAACIRECLSGRLGPKRDVVLINAAAGMWLTGKHADLKDCVGEIAEAIDTGRAGQLVQDLGQLTHASP